MWAEPGPAARLFWCSSWRGDIKADGCWASFWTSTSFFFCLSCSWLRSVTAGEKHKETETQKQKGRRRGKETCFLAFFERRGQSVFIFFNVMNFLFHMSCCFSTEGSVLPQLKIYQIFLNHIWGKISNMRACHWWLYIPKGWKCTGEHPSTSCHLLLPSPCVLQEGELYSK